MANRNLSQLQTRILRRLPIDHPTAASFGVSSQSLSRAIARLEQRGLLRRLTAPMPGSVSTTPRAQRTVRIESTGVG